MFTNHSTYFFWLLLLLCAYISHSQTLEGYVYDEKTKEPLYGVSIYFDETYTYFEIIEIGEDRKVTMTTNKLTIVYDRFHKSLLTIETKDKASMINKFGNYSPPKKLFFGGVLGSKRIGNTLPLDYSF